MTADPQAAIERRVAARHLLAHPLTCKEHDPDTFRLIRRHETELDRWFTQRLGYRLHLASDTARLFKSGVVPEHRPLRTATGRAFHHLEYVYLVLAIASTVAGPAVVSLRDLLDRIRSAAAEADVPLVGDGTERRALVTALRWMIDHGLANELHAQVDAYVNDAAADAVLELRPDRITLLALPALSGFEGSEDLLARASRREATRQWLRARLVEDPVLYREDVSDSEWMELRRRLGEEERFLDEMFGLVLEARAEGVAAIDPTGTLADRPFPAGGTVGHAALLLIDVLRAEGGATSWWAAEDLARRTAALASEHTGHWAADLVAAPDRLARQVVELLIEVRLIERRAVPDAAEEFRLLPAAGRFVAVERTRLASADAGQQGVLW